jgi:hypothetical protein
MTAKEYWNRLQKATIGETIDTLVELRTKSYRELYTEMVNDEFNRNEVEDYLNLVCRMKMTKDEILLACVHVGHKIDTSSHQYAMKSTEDYGYLFSNYWAWEDTIVVNGEPKFGDLKETVLEFLFNLDEK